MPNPFPKHDPVVVLLNKDGAGAETVAQAGTKDGEASVHDAAAGQSLAAIRTLMTKAATVSVIRKTTHAVNANAELPIAIVPTNELKTIMSPAYLNEAGDANTKGCSISLDGGGAAGTWLPLAPGALVKISNPIELIIVKSASLEAPIWILDATEVEVP